MKLQGRWLRLVKLLQRPQKGKLILQSMRERKLKLQLYKQTKKVRLIGYVCLAGFFAFAGKQLADYLDRQYFQMAKMNRILFTKYVSITRTQLIEAKEVTVIRPEFMDELASVVKLADQLDVSVVVDDGYSDEEMKLIAKECNEKCVFIDVSKLSSVKIDAKEGIVSAQLGAKCGDLNLLLEQNGYQKLFFEQLNKESIHSLISHNLPLRDSSISRETMKLELISACGDQFEIRGDQRLVGEIPSLLPLFIGTGGAYSLPASITLNIKSTKLPRMQQETLKINSQDISECIIALKDDHLAFSGSITQLTNQRDPQGQSVPELYLTCKTHWENNNHYSRDCERLLKETHTPYVVVSEHQQEPEFNAIFSVSKNVFFRLQHELRYMPYHYNLSKGVLRVQVSSEDTLTKLVNFITNENGVFVWCRNKKFLKKIKPSIGSSEVGVGVMRRLIQLRKSFDPKLIFYGHQRYEKYFQRGRLRQITQFLW